MRLYEHLVKGDGDSVVQHRKFYEEYLSVTDLPAELTLVRSTVFQGHALPNGTMTHGGERVDSAPSATP